MRQQIEINFLEWLKRGNKTIMCVAVKENLLVGNKEHEIDWEQETRIDWE